MINEVERLCLSFCDITDNDLTFFFLPGIVAILFRQTNVVWVMFMALQAVGPNLMQLIYTKIHENQKVRFQSTSVYLHRKTGAARKVLKIKNGA